MKKVLIVYHSHCGNTEAMAKAFYEGALSSGATVSLKKAVDTTSKDIIDCDAVIFGTPNYFGYMAGALKDLFDRTFHDVRRKANGKLYVVFGSSGDGGSQALDSVDRICNALQFRRAFDGVLAPGKPSFHAMQQCRNRGQKLAQSLLS